MISIGIQSLIRFSTAPQTKHHHHHLIHHVLLLLLQQQQQQRSFAQPLRCPSHRPQHRRHNHNPHRGIPTSRGHCRKTFRPQGPYVFVVQPLRLLAFHLLLLLATYLPLEPRTALIIVHLLSALQVISVVDGLFRYLRRTN
jgi:hypothetical protein